MSSLPQPGPEAVQTALDAITSSPGFSGSERMVRFLRYVVEKSLAGQVGEIKEYTLAVEVFDRDPSFDPKSDTIVRVEARRLRKKLAEYYDGPGREDRVRIELPGPGYAPTFSTVTPSTATLPTPPSAPDLSPPTPSRSGIWIAGAAVLVLALAGWWWMRPAAPQFSSVAVLPFANLSGDPNLEYFSDGFTEEIIGQLASIPNLRVAARTSAFVFKGQSLDMRDIAQRLGVDALVEGSVRRAGDTVRITAQLIRASDGIHIWSKSWDRKLTDVLSVETEVSAAIADSLARTFTAGAAPVNAPANLEARDLYLLGRYHWNKQDPAEFPKAIEYFQQALDKDPNYALAYSGLSEVYSYEIDLDLAPNIELAPKARAAAKQALALNDKLAEAHTSLGLVALDGDWDFPTAEKEFRRAIELKPGFAYGIHWLAHLYEFRNEAPQGEAEMRRAIALDPLSTMFNLDLSGNLLQQRKFAESAAQVAHARQVTPESPFFDVADAMANQDSAKRVALARAAAEKLPVPIVLAVLAQVEAAAGNKREAAAVLAKMQQASKSEYVPGFALALANYATGNQEEGYRWLQKGMEQRNGGLIWLNHWPLFDTVRADPRAVALLDRIGK